MNIQITIDGADAAGANYITWSLVHSSIRLVEADGGADFVDVLLQNQNPGGKGGQILFLDAIPESGQNRLQLRLPTDGTPVEFFIAGKFEHPSVEDKDAVIEVVDANTGEALSTKALMVRIRKNANTLTEVERDRFLEAFAILNNKGNGRFSDFRDMHTIEAVLEGHGNAGFLPWHRAYLLDLERELQKIDPSVALPYWKFDEPAPKLFDRAFIGFSVGGRVEFIPGHPLEFWKTDLEEGIRRTPQFDAKESSPASPAEPTARPINSQDATLLLGGPENLYANFLDMEINPHNRAHGNFRGFLSDPNTAVRDPLFFLLHANVDRLWAKWQERGRRFDTANPATYEFLGSVGDPISTRVGHNLKDTMWPWNHVTGGDRPATAPGGTLATSPTANAPRSMPRVGDMIDYQGVINPGNRLGFDYDDVPFRS